MNNKNGDEIEIRTFEFKGHGKYLLKCTWTVIKKDVDNNKATTVSFDDRIPAVEQQEESVKSIRIELIDTDNPFLIGEPKEKEIIIIRKPGKTDIFVSDPKLVGKITIELNEIKKKWASGLWCANPELTMVSALKTISKNKISGKIVPLIQKIMEKFYGDEK